MTTYLLKPLAIALLLGIAPLSISTAYAVAAVAGPAGPAGATGAKGATGLTGPAGANGINGTNGATGAQGLRGLAGTNGTNGATGARGLTGPSGGVKGDKGDQGIPGAGLPTHAIGDLLNGGIVFWVDETGQHGLIAALQDIPTLTWYNGIIFETNAFGDGLYAGAKNTEVIVAAQSAVAVACRSNADGTYVYKVNCDSEVSANPHYGQQQINAPQAALRYNVQADGVTVCIPGDTSQQCFGEWYLGSLYEMTLLTNASKAAYLTAGVGKDYNLTTDRYWTSTEIDEWGIHSTRGYLAYTNLVYPPEAMMCEMMPGSQFCNSTPEAFAKEDIAKSRPISRF